MDGTLRLVTPPAADPVMLDIARQHLRQDQTEDDVIVALLLKAAVDTVEAATGRALVPQTWDYVLPWQWRCGWSYTNSAHWYHRTITLPLAPLMSVEAVSVGGVDVDPAGYVVDAPSGPTCGRASIRLDYGAGWPDGYADHNALTIRFQAGYRVVPAGLQAAVLMALGSLYENRAAEAETGGGTARSLSANPAFERLIRPFQLL